MVLLLLNCFALGTSLFDHRVGGPASSSTASIVTIRVRDVSDRPGPEQCNREYRRYANLRSDVERLFWEKHDSTEYLDWSKAQKVVLPNLKPTTKTISLRLPQHLLDSIKAAANARDVPYQSLIKVWLQEKLRSH